MTACGAGPHVAPDAFHAAAGCASNATTPDNAMNTFFASGLDTLVPPELSCGAFVATCLLTQKTQESRHSVLTEAMQEGI